MTAGRPPADHPYLEWDGPLPIAHRGGTSEHPENTMPAFARAVDLGFVYLETDVHATRDGHLVAFHDPDLERTCGRAGQIAELDLVDVAAARVGGREPIPLFRDLVEAFPEARFNVDCKDDRALEPLVTELRRLDCLDRVCLGSFSDRRLRRLRREFGPALCTSLGPREITLLTAGSPLAGGGRAAQVPVSAGPVTIVTQRMVERCHRRGLQVHVWTIDDPAEMNRLLDLGVDGIMTDRPEVLRAVLEARGEWSPAG
ncbi:MAG: glycerophosphoryl diester phosphodiesterase [Actinomycetota bacterium]|jgi:glycerophosphoryl diester phosphodiesterase